MRKIDTRNSFLVNRNIYALILFFVLVLIVYILRLYYLQIINGEFFREQSEHNRTRIEDIPAPRGLIYDHNGRLLVENRPAYNVFAVPEEVELERAVKAIANLCHLSVDDTARIIKKSKNRPRFKPIKIFSDVSRDCIAKIEANKFKMQGVFIGIEPVRFYCYGKSASHLLGYLGEITDKELMDLRPKGYETGDWVGKSGLEKILEPYLRGHNGSRIVEVDALGRRLKILDEKYPVPGHAVWLTIDIDLQAFIETLMENVSGASVVMDVRTGAIRAMVSSPGFDPNIFVKGLTEEEWRNLNSDPGHPLLNRVLQSAYPPGSTFKPFVAVAALEEEVIHPDKKLFCPGFFKLGRRSYRCWKREGHGHIALHRAIVESCDVYFYQLGLRLGVDKIAQYARLFGFGKKTGIELPGERRGLIPSKEWKLNYLGQPWHKGETLSVAIGQGYVLVTPLQMVVAYGAIANNGWYVKPNIIEKIEGTKGTEIDVERHKLPVKRKTLQIIKAALEDVVRDKHGTAHKIWDEDIPIAGKTGTAQVVRLREGIKKRKRLPEHLRDHAWFVGYAPASDPEIVIAVIIEHGGHGSSAAAPIVKKIAEYYFKKGSRSNRNDR